MAKSSQALTNSQTLLQTQRQEASSSKTANQKLEALVTNLQNQRDKQTEIICTITEEKEKLISEIQNQQEQINAMDQLTIRLSKELKEAKEASKINNEQFEVTKEQMVKQLAT